MGFPLTEPVLTPKGFESVGNISAGDVLITSDLEEVVVSGCNLREDEPILVVATNDDRTVRSSRDHRWTVLKEGSRTEVEISSEGILTSIPEKGYIIPVMEYGYRAHPDLLEDGLDPTLMGEMLSVHDPVQGQLTLPTRMGSHAKEIHKNLGKVPIFAESDEHFPDSLRYIFPEHSLEGSPVYDFLVESGLLSGNYSEFDISEYYLTVDVDDREKLFKSILGSWAIDFSVSNHRKKYLPLLPYGHPKFGTFLEDLVLSCGNTIDGDHRRITSVYDPGKRSTVVDFEYDIEYDVSLIGNGFVVTGG